uniref:Peptidase S1 domain-containing protein n=1 Tax=Trichogramma kaykai TaxID=54128 RepID=A0ABD2VZH0_9HYME
MRVLQEIQQFSDSENARVVGGAPTTIRDHPYQVSVRYMSRHRCGGAIISSNWIVTAAHCVRAMNAFGITVKAGSTTLSGRGQVVRAKQIIRHENYARWKSDSDIALIQVNPPLSFGSNVQPIDLADFSDDYEPGSKASVTGWGVFTRAGEISNYLREVAVPIISNDECMELYEGRDITERMLCAGYVGVGGRDACQGDSGGPLVLSGRLIGLVSWGIDCASPRYPGVYTRITALRSWINSKTGL